MLPRHWAAIVWLLSTQALAQPGDLPSDWKESQVPPPPLPQANRVIPIEVPGATLRYGVDPASVALGEDGIVRYVVVATSSSGALNATYEGIRCNTGDYRVYARYNPDGGWSTAASGAEWRPLHEGRPFRHALTVARTGACMGRGANRSVAQILRDLGSHVDRRFNNPGH